MIAIRTAVAAVATAASAMVAVAAMTTVITIECNGGEPTVVFK